MKQDKIKTEVIFLIEKDYDESDKETFVENHIMAFFPKENYFPYESDTKVCYAHIGQHSACHLDYANQCKEATEEEYKDLKTELESLGYNLKIVNNLNFVNYETNR